MEREEIKAKKQRKKQEEKKIIARALMEAKVPSARYELSAKPACHLINKNESR